MKIAIVGKGGSGKTTTAAILAREYARRGGSAVVALDCDTNPNLGIALGFGIDRTDGLAAVREALGDDETLHATTIEDVMERFGATGPDGVRLAVVTKIERPNPG